MRGVCGAAGELRVARAALHFWEEPPISGEAGSGTVFFSHCPLHCVYCQNECIAQGRIGRDISIARLAMIFLEQQRRGALNINLVTPTHYVPQILDALDMARSAGLELPVVYNTSGYETPETIEAVAGYVDAFLTDYRYADPYAAARYSHAPDYPEVAIAAIDAMARTQAAIIVRVLLIPGQLESTKQALERLHTRFGNRIAFSLMNQFTPMPQASLRYPELARTVSAAEYEELLDHLDSLGVEEYFWQDGPAADESFIPDFESCEGVAGPELADSVR